jgi:hypothetical protein
MSCLILPGSCLCFLNKFDTKFTVGPKKVINELHAVLKGIKDLIKTLLTDFLRSSTLMKAST